MNKTIENNIRVFTEEIEKYKKDYFRRDEWHVVNTFFRGKKTLVLGCGAGRTLIPLYEKGFEVTGIDITPKMAQAAKEKVVGLPITVREMDACDLKFPDNTFDNIFFPFHGIDYIYPDIYRAVREANRVMKPQGVFIFSSHNRFHIKVLHRFFEGRYADYRGLITYRTTPLDWWKLRKYFQKVRMIQRASIMADWKQANGKDMIYKLMPFFNKSTYFVCMGKEDHFTA